MKFCNFGQFSYILAWGLLVALRHHVLLAPAPALSNLLNKHNYADNGDTFQAENIFHSVPPAYAPPETFHDYPFEKSSVFHENDPKPIEGITKPTLQNRPTPPGKVYAMITLPVLEQRVYEVLGLKMNIEAQLGMGGFGLVFKAKLESLPGVPTDLAQHLSGQKVSSAISCDTESSIEVAVKFFRKPKSIDFRREIHFHQRFEEHFGATHDPIIWDHFPKIYYSSSVPVEFKCTDLDFSKCSEFSDSEDAERWSPNSKPSIFFYSTVIYQFLPFTLREFRPMIESSRYLSIYTKIIFYKILNGISLLYDMDIVHRDIKDRNIMLSFREGLTPETIENASTEKEVILQLMSNLDVKLIDFGLSLDLSSDEFSKGGGKTREYEAPENILRLSKPSRCFDMWSLGILILEWHLQGQFFTRKQNELNLAFIHHYIEPIDTKEWPYWKEGSFWSKCQDRLAPLDTFTQGHQKALENLNQKYNEGMSKMPLWLQHLVTHLLRVCPLYRITPKQALDHPFFFDILGKDVPDHSEDLARHYGSNYGDPADFDPELDSHTTQDTNSSEAPSSSPSEQHQPFVQLMQGPFSSGSIRTDQTGMSHISGNNIPHNILDFFVEHFDTIRTVAIMTTLFWINTAQIRYHKKENSPTSSA